MGRSGLVRMMVRRTMWLRLLRDVLDLVALIIRWYRVYMVTAIGFASVSEGLARSAL